MINIADGLQHTRAWLKRHIDRTGLTLPVSDPDIIRNVTAQTLAKAYLELLEWDETHGYPEVSFNSFFFSLSKNLLRPNYIININYHHRI